MRKEKRNSEFRVSTSGGATGGRALGRCIAVTCTGGRRPMTRGKEVVYFRCFLDLTCLTPVFWGKVNNHTTTLLNVDRFGV